MSALDDAEEGIYEQQYYAELNGRKPLEDEWSKLQEMDSTTWRDYVWGWANETMDYVVPNDAFPAYQILKKLIKSDQEPTPKQRKAIENVYLLDKYGLSHKDGWEDDL